MRQVIGIMMAAWMLSGCGWSLFAEPASNPVIEDSINDVAGTLATTAARRLVVMPLRGDNLGKFCAEPSPDTAEALAATFKGSVDASANVAGKGEGALKAEIERALLTSVAALTKRSQGLQFYRDGVFALCQSRLNGFVDNKEYTQQLYKIRDIAHALILKEIENPNWGALPTVTITPPK